MNKKSNKITSIIVATAMMVANVNVYAFSDLEKHWAEEIITKWAENGFINGFSNGTIRPDDSITRAEFLTILKNSLNLTGQTDIKFTDVLINDWYYDAVSTAVANGITNGKSEFLFDPNSSVTRAEASVFVSKAIDVNVEENVTYTDSNEIPNWAISEISAMTSLGYLVGFPDGKFKPNTELSRAEAIVFLNRVIESKENETDIDDTQNEEIEETETEIETEIETEEDTSNSTMDTPSSSGSSSGGSSSGGSSSSDSSSGGSSNDNSDTTEETDNSELLSIIEKVNEIIENKFLYENDENFENLIKILENSNEYNATKEEIDENISKLNESLKSLILLDITDLNKIIENTYTILKRNVYDEGSKELIEIENILDKAEEIVKLESVTTQAEIDDITNELLGLLIVANEDYELKIWLESVLEKAEMVELNLYLYDVGNPYWDDFVVAYADVLTSSDQELSNDELSEYIEKLESALDSIDKALLNRALLFETMEYAKELNGYDESSTLWKEFEICYANAIGQTTIVTTQEKVDTVTNKLIEAIDRLVNATVIITQAIKSYETSTVSVTYIATSGAEFQFITKDSDEKPDISEFTSEIITGTGNIVTSTISISDHDTHIFVLLNKEVLDATPLTTSSYDQVIVENIEIVGINGTIIEIIDTYEENEDSSGYTSVEKEYVSGSDDNDDCELDDNDGSYYPYDEFETGNVYKDHEDREYIGVTASVGEKINLKVNLLDKNDSVILSNTTIIVNGEVINIYDQTEWTIFDDTIAYSYDYKSQEIELIALKNGICELIVSYVDSTGLKPGSISQGITIIVE